MSSTVTQTQPPVGDHLADSGHGTGRRRRALSVVSRSGPVIGVLVLLLIGTSLFVPYFLTIHNLLNLLQQVAIVGVVSVGMTFVILTAGIDLSVGAILELTTVVCALLLQSGMSPWIAVAVGIAAGGVVGIVNGLGYTLFNIQPFVMTLATLAIAEGVALTISNGREINFRDDSGLISFLGNGGIGDLSGEFVVFAVLAVVGWIVLRYLPFGRYVYAVGGNPETSRLAGVRVKRILTIVYVISGCCAGLAGIMTAARLEVGSPTSGGLMNLNAIAAVVIGGTSLLGGRGSVWGSVLGAFILAIIGNVLTLLGVSPYQSEVIRGIVIIAAVLLGSIALLRKRRRRTAKQPATKTGLDDHALPDHQPHEEGDST